MTRDYGESTELQKGEFPLGAIHACACCTLPH